ncbi:excalibur calcium-binding domain-containing protein [Aneurinibacillus soli]|uniref:SPBc2 prophage-derived endonuclease YokF n=1 Tax=Aneurinibacillus soli TaxID=1500254 RepID=A0A0U5C958_9BACL|nr:excalibur calcium-binding domain-containing protein [Aneurinibacillus soli]BAU28995.1 SPBc2 prophage-derived endonuclease YokF precursor [Aneurinibacillus soli]
MFKKVSAVLLTTAVLSTTFAVGQSDAASKKPAKKVYYKNCTEARKAGVTPIYRGQPGYAPKLDRDHDGIACE